MNIIVTGGSGFIGSNFIRYLIKNSNHNVLNFDCLSYAGSQISLLDIEQNPKYTFVNGDIRSPDTINKVLNDFNPDTIINFAAETHVDRSIDDPSIFVDTNILGTFYLLDCTFKYWKNLDLNRKKNFRFVQISTDEVYGSLENDGYFYENSRYEPSSPYSASKASSDHLVWSWGVTYGLPIILTHCSNNYGPFQLPEKLIPLIILNAVSGQPLPIYGNGLNIRDWIHVFDHIEALYLLIISGKSQVIYNIGGNEERTNVEVINTICEIMDKTMDFASKPFNSHKELITFVKDRPGHDIRYAIDTNKIKNDLGWTPKFSFEDGLKFTVEWYLNNLDWCNKIKSSKIINKRLGQI